MLILLALTAAPVTDNGSGARIDVRATATIQRGVTLHNGSTRQDTATGRSVEVVPIKQKPRDCGLASERAADCGLIVYDLP